jgi:hypothetical protein
MNGLPFRGQGLPPRSAFRLIPALILIGFVVTTGANAANRVYVDVVREGQTQAVTNLYIGLKYEFRVWVENDVQLSSMRVTLRNWAGFTKSPEAFEAIAGYFSWVNVGGYGPTGLNTGHACITVPAGCRMSPPEYVWDFSTVLRVWEYNMNEVSPDTVGFGGTALSHGLPPGPLQPMVSVHFKPNMLFLGQLYIRLDNAFIAPGGGTYFVDKDGALIKPEFSTASPWYIVSVCGDASGDGVVDIADVVYLINYIFKSGPAPRPAAAADANGDLETSIADAVYLITYIFKGGPAPNCGL